MWLCINPNGADDKPSSSSPNWLEQVSKGDKGEVSYLHIKYSNDGGRTFTGNNGEDPGDWLGLLTDLNVNDSTNPADYKWSKTKGEQGD